MAWPFTKTRSSTAATATASQHQQEDGGPESIYHIELRDVHKRLGGRKILSGLSFGVYRGETFVILGLSGTGKSVTIKHMIGLFQPDAGQVLINGVDMGQLNTRDRFEAMRQFGYLFQSGALLNWMSLEDNIALPLRELTPLPESEILKRVHDKLRLVDLAEHAAKLPSEISGGMKKRGGLARAIVREPEIVLYDEPTSGLDPVMSRQVDRLIVKLQKELNITSVVVTHDMESAYMVADRIAFLYKGKMLEIGTPDEIRQTRNPIVKAFITGGEMPNVEGTPDG